MKKKFGISLVAAVILSVLVIGVVLAGSSLDYGTVETQPPVGQVNWTAWFDNAANTLPAGMPREVMTEDATNSDLGKDQGYQLLGSTPTWYAQIDLLEFGKAHDEPVSMIFGGLGASSGKIWVFDFVWNFLFESITAHGQVPLSTQVEACPAITDVSSEGSSQTVSFNGLPNSTYLVYRSRNASGAGNEASNGRYLYLLTVTTDGAGDATFTDISDLTSWYIVIRADLDNNIAGCHSEEANPTNIRLGEFTAVYNLADAAVDLTWETASEVNIVGFNIFRAEDEFGVRQKINPEQIIAKHPGENNGAVYHYQDDDLEPGKEYFYWIEVLGLDSTRESIGPRSVRTGYWIFIPFMH